MRRLQKTIDIKAPIADVYGFLTTPQNYPMVWPSMIEVDHVSTKPDGSHEFDWVYKMCGVRLHGHCSTPKVQKNAYVEARNTGGAPSTFQWKYEAKDGLTRLTLHVEYDVPAAVTTKVAETVAARLNEREIDALLDNVKTTLEAHARGEIVREQRPTA